MCPPHRNFYNLTVLAVDKPDIHLTQRTSSAIIYIYVLNSNTIPPIFTNLPYSFNITEKSPVGTYVGSVVAIDGDAGLSTEVTPLRHTKQYILHAKMIWELRIK